MNNTTVLSLKDKIFQREIRPRIKDLIDGKKINPWVIELDPTTACNLACHGCISANLLNQGGFERERLKDLAHEFVEAGIKAVVLIGGGEPMAHPEFGNIVDIFYENDIHVGVTSNGMMINKYLDQLKNKTKWVRISVDAGTEEVFNKYRPHVSGKSQFNRVIDGMKKLALDRKGRLGYSFLILTKLDENGKFLETNAIDIENAAHVAKEIGCDYFEVKPSFDIFHFLNDASDVSEIVNDQLSKIKNLKQDNFDIISPYTLEGALQGSTVQEKNYKRCLTTELRAVFSPSGAYVCPYHRGNNNLKIGDPNTQTFREIWDGEIRKKTQEKLDASKHCKFHCIRHHTNLALEEMAKNKNFDILENFDRFI